MLECVAGHVHRTRIVVTDGERIGHQPDEEVEVGRDERGRSRPTSVLIGKVHRQTVTRAMWTPRSRSPRCAVAQPPYISAAADANVRSWASDTSSSVVAESVDMFGVAAEHVDRSAERCRIGDLPGGFQTLGEKRPVAGVLPGTIRVAEQPRLEGSLLVKCDPEIHAVVAREMLVTDRVVEGEAGLDVLQRSHLDARR